MFDKIIDRLSESAGTEELNLVNEAYNLAKERSKSEHYLRVASIVSELNADSTMIIAALLHDAYAKEDITYDEINEKFGSNIANLVANLIKLRSIKLNDYNESSSVYLRKVLVGISDDVRVIIIKLADRLDEMQTKEYSEEEKKQIANETMNVLIPIAHRLGINSIKSKLEDLCLRYTKPDVYDEILEKLSGTRKELSVSLEDMQNELIEILTEHGINFHIKSRVKSVYSIYNKLSTGKKWSDIYDILALRIILDTPDDCYLVVGLIHAKYRPIPKRFKDYIAMPKENMYQSLHTSVFGVDGHIFEIQLRTKEMDEIAEHGIASHWSYKEHSDGSVKNLMEQKLEIFRNTIDLATSDASNELFEQNMEMELLSKQVYVFTPKGDVMELPLGSTPVDFAYRIHSDIGDHMVGAIVNDNIVPLDYELNDNDIIKVNTNASAKPNIDWLKFVKTSQAKNKIKAYFSKQDRERYIEEGKSLIEKELRKQKLPLTTLNEEENVNKLFKTLKINNMDDLYLSLGALRYTPTYIINLITEEKQSMNDLMLERVNNNLEIKENYKNDIIVDGVDNIKVSVAKCCNPVPGDEIIGYITKGEGIIVHKKSCPNIKNIDTRLIDVDWNSSNSDKLFIARLRVMTDTTNNHILDIVTKASTRGITISSINEINDKYGLAYEITVKVKNKDDLLLLVDDLRILPFVKEVIR
ncbi:MAG: RelA/SpoT family protein [Tenericutes bacterium]|nr:RelA/SpoT family protein [Mycoplasmatota bacterium]